MKYRVQLNAVFNNSDANDILNQMESIKDKVFNSLSTIVPIIRETKKDSYDSNPTEELTEYVSIDFDATQATHSDVPPVSDLNIKIDISFTVQQDFYDCINYLESIKNLAQVDKLRFGRIFDCNHDEDPLINDGTYIYTDFDGTPLTYS